MALRYIFDQDALVADFVARSKIASGATKRAAFTDRNLRAVGIANSDNELIAGIVYFNFNPEAGTIDMSVEALPKQRWLTPSTLAIMFQYPFLHCGCQMVMTRTEARNEHVLRMLAAMNFKLILIPRSGGRTEDGVIALLTYEDWLESKFCRRYGHHIPTRANEAA
jgi:RimJ/RimL family protein N-acetyltransferase